MRKSFPLKRKALGEKNLNAEYFNIKKANESVQKANNEEKCTETRSVASILGNPKTYSSHTSQNNDLTFVIYGKKTVDLRKRKNVSFRASTSIVRFIDSEPVRENLKFIMFLGSPG